MFSVCALFMCIVVLDGAISMTLNGVTPSSADDRSCREPMAPRNGSVVVWGNGMLIEYMCDTGFFSIGRTFGSCNHVTGKWTVRRPICVAPGCQPPDQSDNGKIYLAFNNTVATLVCNHGYRLVGSMVRYCDGRTWKGYRSKCRDRYASTDNRHQERDIRADDDGVTTVTYEQLMAEDVLDADNSCYHSYTAPPDIEHAEWYITYKYNSAKRQWILIANYTCHEGFRFQDDMSRYRYCKGYNWTARVDPQCVAILTPVNMCAATNGGCAHVCVSRGRQFQCECRKGYSLGSNFRACNDIDECRLDNGGCDQMCNNLPGSYFCSCWRGYVPSGNRCLDIDECGSDGDNTCPGRCINTPGSYTCNCSIPGYQQTTHLQTCLDIDECASYNGGCFDVCVNLRGSYRCGCTMRGYLLAADGRTCTDLDECLRYGGRRCEHGTCQNTIGSYQCTCEAGYTLSRNKHKCTDVNECQINNGGCGGRCLNTPGSFICHCLDRGDVIDADETTCITECSRTQYEDPMTSSCSDCPPNSHVPAGTQATSYRDCVCDPGYHGDPAMGEQCRDIDDCVDLGCEHDCVDGLGSARCTCPGGYRLVNGTHCVDHDECRTETSNCSQGCTNTDGGYECHCWAGYRRNIDGVTCDDIDECYEGLLNCSHECVDTVGGAHCDCPTGFQLTSDNTTCIDVDECETGVHVCDDKCINTEGAYTCHCVGAGFKLSWDMASCSDINECMEGENSCQEECINTRGSYTCACSTVGLHLAADGHTCTDPKQTT